MSEQFETGRPNEPSTANRLPYLPDEWVEKPSKLIGAVLAVIVFIGIFVLPVPDGMTQAAFRAILMLVVAMCLWLPEVFHPAVTSLFLVVVLPMTGVTDLEHAASGLGNKIIWLLLGVSLLTAALQNSGLDNRLAYLALRRSGGTPQGVLMAVIVAGIMFSFMIPNAVARTAMLVPLCVGILNTMGLKPLQSNFGKSLLIATSMTSLLSSAVVMTGASATIYAAGYFESVLGHHWSYFHWLITMLPGVLLTCLALWFVLLRVFPPEIKNIKGGLQYIDDELKRLGTVTRDEWKLIWLFGLLFLLLLFGDRLGIAREAAFLLIGLLLFLPGINILSWSSASKKVGWGTLVFFAASLTLSQVIVDTGAADWLAGWMVHGISDLPVWLISLSVMLMFLVLRFAFTNMTSVLITLMPVIVPLAISVGLNPVWLGMIAVVSSALCLFTPMQSASNFTSYTAGYYSVADFAKAGSIMAVAVMAITLAMALLYWPLVGLPVM